MNINMESTPKNLIFHICEFIKFNEMIILGMTCTKFKELFELPERKESDSYLKYLMMNKIVKPTNISQLFKYNNIVNLDLSLIKSSPIIIWEHVNWSKLKHLELCDYKSDSDCRLRFLNIESLVLNNCYLSPIIITAIRDLPLKKLSIIHCNSFYYNFTEYLQKTKLVELKIECNSRLKNSNINYFVNLPLKKLSLFACRFITNIDCLCNMQLDELDIGFTNIKDYSQLPKSLKKLSIDTVNADNIQHLLDLKLEKLHIHPSIYQTIDNELLIKLKQHITDVQLY